MSNIITKQCTSCHQDFPATKEYFYTKRNKKGGNVILRSKCKQCYCKDTDAYYFANHERGIEIRREYGRKNMAQAIERSKKSKINNPQKHKETARLYKIKNREVLNKKVSEWQKTPKGIQARKKYAETHRENQREASQRYNKSHPEHGVRHAQIRRARKRVLPATLTHEDWETILREWNYACAYCGKAWFEVDGVLQQDHVIPLSKGGGYVYENIVPACGKCNGKKHNKTPEQAGMPLRER